MAEELQEINLEHKQKSGQTITSKEAEEIPLD